MMKTYPRLERRKLARMKAGKRPYRTPQEKEIYVNTIARYLDAANSGDVQDGAVTGGMPNNSYCRRAIVYQGGIPQYRKNFYKPHALPECEHDTSERTMIVEITDDMLLHIIACIKAGKYEQYKTAIDATLQGKAAFMYPHFNEDIAELKANPEKTNPETTIPRKKKTLSLRWH